MIRRNLARTAALGFVGLALSSGLYACSGIRTPSFFGLNKGGKSKEHAAVGQRISVLGASDSVEVAPALKGVDFSIPEPQAQADWPLPGGNAEQAVDHMAAGAQFRVAWRRRIGTGTSRRGHITGAPVVGDHHIFTLDGEGGVTSLDETGREIWRDQFAPRRGRDTEAFGGGVAYADGTLFVSSGFRFIAAVNAADGKVKWRVDTAAPIHGAPTVVDGKLFVSDVDDQLFALDAATGKSLWEFQALEEPARMLEASSAAVSSGVVVAPFASGEVVALSTINGTQLWEDELSLTNRNNALSEIRDIAGRPIVYRGDVIAGSHAGIVAAIDLHTGNRRWAVPITTVTSPWPAGDVIYVTDTSGRVICIARDSGQVYWIRDLNRNVKKKQRAIYSGPVLAAGRLIVVNDKGLAVALNPKTGATTTTLKLGAPAFLNPIGVNGTLYVLTLNGEVVAIR
ncbi:PQQ-like beta-propeller repeat protein [Caulobacter sp. S45]|jgi:outer membrane protein assembly factor BamB|uniref:PQQ-like beta-propeller repeat protein n=1 Tax=Caulobacter sp. S45 TaxID=1641861 RepID=UPI00131AFF3A|nr:PQQ-like beta-propeller repeat protein [Caulobacter sp. S45]